MTPAPGGGGSAARPMRDTDARPYTNASGRRAGRRGGGGGDAARPRTHAGHAQRGKKKKGRRRRKTPRDLAEQRQLEGAYGVSGVGIGGGGRRMRESSSLPAL